MKTVETNEYVHVQTCKDALINDSVFNNFKSISAYTKILEHTSKSFGKEYIKLLFNEFKYYVDLLDWKKLKENDSIGNPNIVNFSSLGDGIESYDYNFSPSTIYYIYRGLHIINNMLKNKEELNILEIGGGYGGQCKLLLDMCEMLNVKINSYGIIDLEYVSKLQKKYLGVFGYKNVEFFEFENLTDFNYFEKYNVLISIYALGEFTIETQDFYVNKIIKEINNHYVIWNTEKINNYYLNDNIVDEIPKTGRFNKLIMRNEK